MACRARRCHDFGKSGVGGASGGMDVVGAVGLSTFGSGVFVIGDFSAVAGESGRVALAFDFFFGGFFIEPPLRLSMIRGPTFFRRLARDLLPPFLA